MEAEDLKLGQMVRPLQRSLNPETRRLATHSVVWRWALEKGQEHLYVQEIDMDHKDGVPRVLCGLTPDSPEADWFADVDLVPYVPPMAVDGHG